MGYPSFGYLAKFGYCWSDGTSVDMYEIRR